MKKRVAVFAVLLLSVFLFLGCNEYPVVRLINNTSLSLEVYIDYSYIGTVYSYSTVDFPVDPGVHYVYVEDADDYTSYTSTYTNDLLMSGCSNEPSRFDYTINPTSTKGIKGTN